MNSHASSHSRGILIPFGVALALTLAGDYAMARGLIPRGLYEIVVTQEGPAAKTSEPLKLQECLTKTRIINAAAFHVRGEHAVRQCPISDARFNGEELLFRIVCSEAANAPSARAKFVHTRNGYEGTITINTGDKKKRITEHQVAKRIGECPGDGTDSNVEIDAMHWRSEPAKAVPTYEQKDN